MGLTAVYTPLTIEGPDGNTQIAGNTVMLDPFDPFDPRSREMEIQMNLPGFSEPVSLIGSPMKFSRTKVDYRLPPPRVGEHTEQVLMEYGILLQNIISVLLAGKTLLFLHVLMLLVGVVFLKTIEGSFNWEPMLRFQFKKLQLCLV